MRSFKVATLFVFLMRVWSKDSKQDDDIQRRCVVYPSLPMMKALPMVRGTPAMVPTAKESPMVSLVEPRSSRNQKRYASRNPHTEPQMKKINRNMKMCGFKINFHKFLNTFLAGCLKLLRSCSKY